MDVSNFGDMTIRDFTTRHMKVLGDLKMQENSTLAANDVNITGKLTVNGKVLEDQQQTTTPNFDSVMLSEIWRLIVVNDILFIQKKIDGEWVNKQCVQ